MTTFDTLSDPMNFVLYWVKGKTIIGNEQAKLHLAYDREVKMYNTNLRNRMATVREGEAVKVKYIKPISPKLLEHAFESYLQDLPILRRTDVLGLVKNDKENLEPLRQWITAVTGSCTDVNLNVMAHWLWLVKRRLSGLPVVYQIMPIVASPQTLNVRKQGGGKSTAIESLLSPLSGVITTLRMDQVSDDRNFTAFTNYMVAFLDEMAGHKKVIIEDFKRIVTSQKLMYRPMRTNTQVLIDNLCNFIGASNLPLSEIIRDTTGNRRFFELVALEKLNHELVNSIDYVALWKGVDEKVERGYYERVRSQIEAMQGRASIKDDLETFLEDFNITPEENGTELIVKSIYDHYVVHIKSHGGDYPLRYQTFCNKLEAMGFKMDRRRDNKSQRYRVISTNANHALGLKKDMI